MLATSAAWYMHTSPGPDRPLRRSPCLWGARFWSRHSCSGLSVTPSMYTTTAGPCSAARLGWRIDSAGCMRKSSSKCTARAPSTSAHST
eukprot:2559057-Rhodomonas_salina.3